MNLKIATTGALSASEKSPIVFRGDYASIIKKAKEIGYDGVELHINDSTQINRKKMKENLNNNNLTLTSIGTGSAYAKDGISLSHPDIEKRKAAIKRIEEHILTAKDYNAIVIIGLVKGLISDCNSVEEFYDNLENSLNECLDFAEKNNVILGLEVINRYESELFNTIEETLDYVSKFNSNSLKIHIDTYHMNIEERDYREIILKAGNKIGHCHIADSDRWYAGHGHFDFKEVFEALNEINYNGVLAVESYKFPNSIESAKKSLETINNIIKEIS